jgi:hypothetical protein
VAQTAGQLSRWWGHDEQRFAEVLATLCDGVTTAWDIAARMG